MTTLTNTYHETDHYAIDQHADLVMDKLGNALFVIPMDVTDEVVSQFEHLGQYVKTRKGKDELFDGLCAVALATGVGESSEAGGE